MKIKIIPDSSCGLTKEQALELGWDLLPIRAEIDNKTYEIGVNITVDEFAKIWRANKKVDALTFATPPGQAQILVDKYLAEGYDMILFYPISNKLSSQTNSLKTFFKDNKQVYVVDSIKISYLIFRDLLLFDEKIKAGEKFEDAIKHFSKNEERTILIPEFNDALVKGGRLSKSAAAIAKLLKIVPVIKFDEKGALEKESIGRVFNKMVEKYANELIDEKSSQNSENHYFIIMHSNNLNIKEFVKKIKENKNLKNPVLVSNLSTEIAIHTGIGAICMVYVKIDEEIKETVLKYFEQV
ncbi:DegV family protein [Mycoplasma struthionis]|uniref:DegV family EDD domain-containing protein n=1 Tax=Mycoplasma struthionis TaxID=538220 RepID=A0A3G8LH50_9MOLU|nr:DegV family protein [Mycoplasma struthionis]AZG68861.1 DegV family EDD domain-containing protein [Mycoplasma struthionis]TPI01313.1 DegV family EDD domain-containing protein [Mycoplasma struthionis]